MTPHISAKEGEIANIVLMPGDPLRAKMIAENYLENVKIVSEVRGNNAYTGFFKNKKVTVIASGMGIPSMGIYSYELFKYYDVDYIIRIGSCGVFDEAIKLLDLVLVKASYSDSTYAKVQNGSDLKLIEADIEVTEKIENKIKEKTYYAGTVYCTDVFYSEKKNKDLIAVEMETFSLFHNAKFFNKKAAALLTVSDNIITNQKLSPKEREQSFTKMIETVLEMVGDL